MRIAMCLGLAVLCLSPAYAEPARTACVFVGEHPDAPTTLGKQLTADLAAAGYATVPLSSDQLCAGIPKDVGLLVLADAASLPLQSTAAISAYLERGGDLIALKAPLWDSPNIFAEGVWTTEEDWRRDHAIDLPEHVIFPFNEGDVDNWDRAAFKPEREELHETVAEGPAPGQRALHVSMPYMENWDNCGRAFDTSPFPEGHRLVVFSAKGGPGTRSLAIEMQERDGSRWFAVVPLRTHWQRYVLRPEDFEFWQSVPSRANSTWRPENTQRIMIGLAHSHTGGTNQPHEYWVGPFGCERPSDRYDGLRMTSAVPKLDILSPGYKFFDLTGSGVVSAISDTIDAPATAPETVRCAHPRPEAGGFAKGRDWRWMPLLEANSDTGGFGHPAAMRFNVDGPCKGGMWAAFGIGDTDWYETKLFRQVFEQVLRRMKDRVVIIDGGTPFYTYFENQPVKLGLTVANLSRTEPGEAVVRAALRSGEDVLASRSWTVSLAPGEVRQVSEEVLRGLPDSASAAPCEAFVEAGTGVADRFAHEVWLWKPKAEKHFVVAQNGEFRLDGERWRPHGINYMPSSGIATEDGEYFEYWVGARSYDPRIIQRDLDHVVDLGFNSVSIFIHRPSMESQNLLDLLRRVDALGLKANLSLRPGTPIDFLWDQMREMIEYYRLWEHDAVFVYDLAWEPMFYTGEQESTRGEWEAWVKDRYGSIENAEADWGCAIPRDDAGGVTYPPVECQDKTGPYRVMMAAYRRFVDNTVHARYREARRLVRTLDPNHAVSFRMNIAGDPTSHWRPNIAYDFGSLGAAVDVLEPEGYGRIGDWDKVKPGFFTHTYARWACPDLPMFWAEAGLHAWDMGAMESTPEMLERQAAFFERMYRMFVESAADGIYWWWYPGGYRCFENSDYGVVNADGSDRPVSKVIRAWGSRVTEGADPAPVDTWLTMKRDYYGNGLVGIYDDLEADYWAAIDAGKTPGLRTEGTGTTSEDCPLVAVGGTPCNGNNPPMYLDGAFDATELDETAGMVRFDATNTAEATWKADGPGAVRVVDADGRAVARLPHDVPRYGTVRLEAPAGILRLEAEGRVAFGPRLRVGENGG